MIKNNTYTRGNIYLSGSMEFAPDGQLGKTWRADCSIALKNMGYCPLDITALDIAYSEQHGEIFRHTSIVDALQRKMHIRKHFIQTDLDFIKNDSDALIVLLDDGVRKGAGTISECQYAYNHDIPIFVVNSLPSTEKISGWFFALSTKIFDTFDELYSYLNSLPEGILKRDMYDNHHAGKHYLCSLCGEAFEKKKTHFVSKVSPLYCMSCVETVKKTYEDQYDRYKFFIEYLTKQSDVVLS